MEINDLYKKAMEDGPAQEAELFRVLTVRFRIIACHRIGNNEDAEDVVQESLAIIFREFRKITFHSSFVAWAYEVLKHRILSFYEKRDMRNRKSEPLDEAMLHPEAAMTDECLGLRTSLIDCLKKMARHNIRYARILNLHHQGYDTEEICRKLNINTGNFYIILFRARAILDKCLREKGYYGREV
jgi:RNA polymerase sigma-70 factor (ECF subfamily)